MEKRGLSTVVSTILLVLLVLVAIGIVWAAIGGLLTKGTDSLALGSVGLDVQIKSASVNGTTGMMSVKVQRNPGISKTEIKSLKFIVEDETQGDVFEIRVQNFGELAVRTFALNLTQNGILDVKKIIKVSVAPVYVSETSGKETLAPVTSFLDLEKMKINQNIGPCTIDLDCGVTDIIPDSETCSGKQLLQYIKEYKCIAPGTLLASCQTTIIADPIQLCAETQNCSASQKTCISSQIPCTQENMSIACGGESHLLGFPTCSLEEPSVSIIQDYDQIQCLNGFCDEKVISKTIEDCEPQYICGVVQGNPECFKEVDCTKNDDCLLGQVCREGLCVSESVAITGTVSSIWPFTLGEYFDSPNLPNNKSNQSNYEAFYIVFPESLESRCLNIKEYVYPNLTSQNAYVRLSKPETNVASGLNFEIWETSYGCSLYGASS